MRLETFVLTGKHVQLVPLAREHAAALVIAGAGDRSTYGFTPVPETVPAMEEYVDGLLGDALRGTVVPFAQRRRADGELVGCTRFLNIIRWANRETPAEVEIGGTWLAADAQRSPINTEAKLLLLTHAFEVWKVFRVAICTDALNLRSRDAIERLGARLEGIMRNHRPNTGHLTKPGQPRNTATYSIIPDEWPDIQAYLKARLDAG